MIVYGRNVFSEYIKQPKKVRKIIFQEGFRDQNYIFRAEKAKIPYEYADKSQLDRLANGVHQGIIMEIEDYHYVSLDELITDSYDQFFLLLDHLEDPHNLGAIIRTCEAAGVDGIILPKDRSVMVNATVVKTSAATVERVPICMVTNLRNAISTLKKHGFWIVGTDMEGEVYLDLDYRGKTVIVIGNEGEGMSRLVQNSCDFIARIPMYGKVNSLNASVSAGIMIYEVLRQKNR